MSVVYHCRKGKEPLANYEQLLDTNMNSLEARMELSDNVNAGTVCPPAQRGSIGIQHHNPNQGDKATGGLSNRQGSPPTKLLKCRFIEAHPATRVPMML